jgi:uncharacterized low-complexity protein
MAPPMAPAAKPDVPPAIMRLTQSSARSVAIAQRRVPLLHREQQEVRGVRSLPEVAAQTDRGEGKVTDAEAAAHGAERTQHRQKCGYRDRMPPHTCRSSRYKFGEPPASLLDEPLVCR